MTMTAPRRAIELPLPDLTLTLPEVAVERGWQTLWEGIEVDSILGIVLVVLVVTGTLAMSVALTVFGALLVATSLQAMTAWIHRRYLDKSGHEDEEL